MAAECERRQCEGLRHRDRLDDQEQASLVRPVGDEPAPRPEEEHRPELGRRQRPDGHTVVRQLEDEEGLGDQGEPVADLRDELSDEEQPEVPHPQRPERVPRPAPQRPRSRQPNRAHTRE